MSKQPLTLDDLELERVTLGPDDVLVLKSPRPLKPDYQEEIRARLARLGIPGRRVIWIDPSIVIDVVSEADADQAAG